MYNQLLSKKTEFLAFSILFASILLISVNLSDKELGIFISLVMYFQNSESSLLLNK